MHCSQSTVQCVSVVEPDVPPEMARGIATPTVSATRIAGTTGVSIRQMVPR